MAGPDTSAYDAAVVRDLQLIMSHSLFQDMATAAPVSLGLGPFAKKALQCSQQVIIGSRCMHACTHVRDKT